MAQVLISWFCGLVPKPVRPLYRAFLLTHVDPRMMRACGLGLPCRFSSWASHTMMKTVGKRDPLPDNAPNGLELLARSIYPDGWQVNKLGIHLDVGDQTRAAAP
jgi:hypothetical protein